MIYRSAKAKPGRGLAWHSRLDGVPMPASSSACVAYCVSSGPGSVGYSESWSDSWNP